MEMETKSIKLGYFFLFANSSSLTHNRQLLIFSCDTKGTLNGLQLLKPILCNVHLAMHWNKLRDAPALNSAVICPLVVDYVCARLSFLSLTNLFQPE
ncbi:uncharacterized protein TNCT_358161 [Trichonephila clavata]|uniref:Uncharacterized protein n=1 Tax=Trichonephila clavata TaxID=2740835 RepID=A0A8X6KRM6_TRICU|nr:uncharacterized protein TNCT_358161 [Trichonephila clavata]